MPGYLTAPTGGAHVAPTGAPGGYPAPNYGNSGGQPQGQPYLPPQGKNSHAVGGPAVGGPVGGGPAIGGPVIGGQVVGVDPHAQVLVDGQPQKPPSGPKVSLMDKVKALFRDWF